MEIVNTYTVFTRRTSKRKRTFRDIEVCRFAYRILSGLKYLHDIGHYHGGLHLKIYFGTPKRIICILQIQQWEHKYLKVYNVQMDG